MFRACVVIGLILVNCLTARAQSQRPPVWEVNGSAYRITLWRDGQPAQPVIVEGGLPAESGQSVHHPQGLSVRVFWEDAPSGERKWRIEAVPDANSGLGIFEVEFPLLVLHPLRTDGQDRLIVPSGSGKVIRDPFKVKERFQGGRPHEKKAIWYGIYGQLVQSMQMVIYDSHDDKAMPGEASRGVMIWTADPDLNIKDFEVSNDLRGCEPGRVTRPAVRATVHHYPGNSGQPGTEFKSAYPVIVTPYDQGWESAAMRYRDWAVAQSWCSAGTILERIDKGELPKWYRRNVVWTTMLDGGTYDLMKNSIRRAFPGVEIGVFLTKWQRWPFDVNIPDYFPPNDEPDYRRTLTLQNDGFHIFPYMNVHSVDIEQPNPRWNKLVQTNIKGPGYPLPGWNTPGDPFEYWGRHEEKTREFIEDLRAVRGLPWTDPRVQALVGPEGGKLYSSWFWRYDYEKKSIHDYLQANWDKKAADGKPDMTILNPNMLAVKRKFQQCCRHSDQWFDDFGELMGTNLKPRSAGGYGTDGHYLDQFDYYGTMFVCFSSSHSLRGSAHKPGYGNYLYRAGNQLTDELHKTYPGKILMAEHCFEGSIKGIQAHYVIFPEYYKNELAPLWAMVYQGYTSFHEWPVPEKMLANLDDFTSSLAWSTHLGFKIGSFVRVETWIDLFKPQNERPLSYLRNLVGVHMKLTDWVAYGRRLADPILSAPAGQTLPVQSVNWMDLGSKPYPQNVPAVRGSCWRNYTAPGKTLFLLSNTSARPVEVLVGTSRPTVAGQAIDLLQEKSPVADLSKPVTVPAYGWVALVAENGER